MIKNSSPTVLAIKLGVSRQAVHRTINGTIKGKRIREAIAEAIGKSVAEVWPEVEPDGGQKNTPAPGVPGALT